MKQRRLTLAIATVLGSFPLAANAEVDLSAATPTGTVWATELNKDDTASVLPDDGIGQTNAFAVRTAIGFGYPANTTRHLRLDLSNGAKFTSELTCSVDVPLGTCIKRTGGANESFAVFALATTDPNGVAAGHKVSFELSAAGGTGTAGVRAINNSPVQVTYSLHNNDVSADKPNQSLATGILYDDSLPDFISFAPVLSVAGTASAPLVADVATGFTKFEGSAGKGPIGTFRFGSSGTAPLTIDPLVAGPPLLNAAATVADVVTSATLTVSGIFTATQDVSGITPLGTYTTAPSRVFLDGSTAADCNGTAGDITPATTVTADTATFNLTTADTYAICFQANGISPIEASAFNMNVEFVAKDGYNVEAYSLENVGEIVLNGTILDTPYITKTAGYISRVYFTNTGSDDANYEAIFVTDEGATTTAGTASTGVIPAGANVQINAADLVDFSAKPRGAIRFIISAPQQDIQGVYQTVNLNTGDVQSVVMIRQGGG